MFFLMKFLKFKLFYFNDLFDIMVLGHRERTLWDCLQMPT